MLRLIVSKQLRKKTYLLNLTFKVLLQLFHARDNENKRNRATENKRRNISTLKHKRIFKYFTYYFQSILEA